MTTIEVDADIDEVLLEYTPADWVSFVSEWHEEIIRGHRSLRAERADATEHTGRSRIPTRADIRYSGGEARTMEVGE